MASRTPLKMPPKSELADLYFNKGLKYNDLSQLYHVSLPTLVKWFKLYEMNPRKKYEIIEKGGKKFKRCFGPLHPPGGELLPISKFHSNKGKKGNVQPRCTACNGVNQRVPFMPYGAWVESIYRRLGFSESVRRLGVDDTTLQHWLGKSGRGKPKTLRRESAIKITTLMAELKATGEVRHRKSIRRGAKMRGEIERVPSRTSDYLIRHGDSDTEFRKNYRRAMSDEQRAEENRRDRERRKALRLAAKEAA